MKAFTLSNTDYRKMVKDWVNQQDDDREYDFDDTRSCLVGQFLREHPDVKATHGFAESSLVGEGIWWATHSERDVEGHAAFEALSPWPHTFGRAKAAMASHPLWADL